VIEWVSLDSNGYIKWKYGWMVEYTWIMWIQWDIIASPAISFQAHLGYDRNMSGDIIDIEITLP
jgi:hypothetical protein